MEIMNEAMILGGKEVKQSTDICLLTWDIVGGPPKVVVIVVLLLSLSLQYLLWDYGTWHEYTQDSINLYR